MSEELNVLRVVRAHPKITHIDATPLHDPRLSLAAKGLYAVLYATESETEPGTYADSQDDLLPSADAAWAELARCGYLGGRS